MDTHFKKYLRHFIKCTNIPKLTSLHVTTVCTIKHDTILHFWQPHLLIFPFIMRSGQEVSKWTPNCDVLIIVRFSLFSNIYFLYLLTYLLTPWCRVLLEKLTGLHLVKKFPAFYGTRKFITALTSVRHLSLSCASPIQSTYPHPTSWRSILILSTHLRLGLPSGLFPSGFPTKTLYAPSHHPYAPHAQPTLQVQN